MMNLAFIKQLATALTQQFGQNCEIVYHDLTKNHLEESIVIIENGHVTGRKIGGGPSQVVLDALKSSDRIEDHLGYRIHTKDGKTLKSSTIYVRNEKDKIVGILGINYDITELMIAERGLLNLTNCTEEPTTELVTQNVHQLLDALITQSVEAVGKPVALMKKTDKIKAIEFLNQHGAFLITKSADVIADYFGISKYTIYNYTNVNK